MRTKLRSVAGLAARRLAVAGFVAAALAAPGSAQTPASSSAASAPAGLRFELRPAPAALDQARRLGLEVPITGRGYVILSRDSTREPRQQVRVNGVPIWGVDVTGMGAGGSVVIADGGTAARSAEVLGYPLARIADLPRGEYWVQGFVNVYTTFRRADGKLVRMHQEAGDGQNPWSSPGNLYSRPVKVTLDPARGGTTPITLSEVIQPADPVPAGGTTQQGNPPDRELVKYVKIRSDAVSRFWGRDMYVGANVLLPRDYFSNPTRRYPVLYLQGHDPGGGAPFGFGAPARGGGGAGGAAAAGGGASGAVAAGGAAASGGAAAAAARPASFDDFWLSEAAPGLIVVTIRDANPFYDTSYSLNSANLGPYGDAITRELIPYIEKNFRAIPESWARTLAGGSTGGWEALAMQVFYPDLFGGTWAWCPDPVDFDYYQIVNVYKDANAYTTTRGGWATVERPGMRAPDGNVQYTMRDENRFEQVVGTRGRSAGQWAIWEAVFGPVADDGYPRSIWDPTTGAIDHGTADYWKEHYDITEYLRRNWSSVGPKLQGKVHVAVGDADSYYLNEAVYLLDEFLKGTTAPKSDAEFEYGRLKPHCWTGASRENPGQDLGNAEFVRILGRYLEARRPKG